ncbi:MAG: hypothetical protein ACOYK9_05930 [Chlamydiia bacterium]
MHIIGQKDANLNFWQLASIIIVPTGIPGILLSKTLADTYGCGAAITSILCANLILWFIAFTIVSMTAQNRKNAIENAEEYIGKMGALLVSVLSMATFPIWGAIQMETSVDTIANIYDVGPRNILTAGGIFLGIILAIMAQKGQIRLIKQLTVPFLPILICYHLCSLFFVSEFKWIEGAGLFSLPCTFACISFIFVGIVNFPTFCRYSRSSYDTYLSLTLMTIVITFFEISSIWIGPDILLNYTFANSSGVIPYFALIFNGIFITFLLFSSTLVNIYFSYPFLVTLAPKIKRTTALFLIGLIVTFIFGFIRIFPDVKSYMGMLQILADDFIKNLGVVLVIIFGFRLMIQHRPKPFEKFISLVSWIVGCSATFLAVKYMTITPPSLIGMWATIGFFGLVMFIEEPFWSWRKLQKINKCAE